MAPLIFRQQFDRESCTYTYLLADGETKEAILIDPVDTKVERDSKLLEDLGLTLIYALNTHVHADHITGTAKLKQLLPNVKSVLGLKAKPGCADKYLDEDEKLQFGSRYIVAKSTAGHTDGCTSYILDDSSMVFTGDTMFVRGCGRTDFQQGSSENLYDNVHKKLFTLPDSCTVYPGHDYKGHTCSTIGEEKRLNPRLTKSKADFVELMKNLNLSVPSKIDVAVPANLVCGYVAAEPGEKLASTAIAARLRLPNTVVVSIEATCVADWVKANASVDKASPLVISASKDEVGQGATLEFIGLGYRNAVNAGNHDLEKIKSSL